MDHKPIDVAPKVAVQNGCQEFLHFTLCTLNLKFDPAIHKVLYCANHFKPSGNGFDGKAEPNALDVPFV